MDANTDTDTDIDTARTRAHGAEEVGPMDEHGTDASPLGLEKAQVPPARSARSGGRKTLNSLLWALLLPAVMIFGAGVGQWVIWVGVVIMLASAAVAACLVGGFWQRAGAATVAAFGGFALMLFAGPAVYESYMNIFGTPVPAVVTEVTDRHNRRGADMFCSVEEIGGEHRRHEVSQQQNCFGQAKVGDRVEIREDPLGLFDPRLPDSPDQRNTTEITLVITAGLTLLTAGAIFSGGQRRRDG